jgi:hypothetical protein
VAFSGSAELDVVVVGGMQETQSEVKASNDILR